MAITALPVFSLTAQAQRQVHVTELQKQPDGTEVYVPKTIEVPEESAEELAAAKRKAATVTAEEDDLQYFLNNLAMTRAGESPVVIDLSTFKDTIRQTTLQVNQGISLKFTNGTLKRASNFTHGPVVKISNGTEVELDATVIISGENIENGGEAVDVEYSSLKTAAWIGNTNDGTKNACFAGIDAYKSKLEVVGGTTDVCPIWYNGIEPLIISGGKHWSIRISSDADAIISGENTYIQDFTLEKNTSKLYLQSTIKHLRFFDTINLISDGYAIATGYDG